MKSEYRRAKNFRLDECLDVNDEFTVNKKNQLPKHRRLYRRNNIYHIYGNAFNRFIESNVGRPVDNVYSDFCRRPDGSLKMNPDVRDAFKRTVNEVFEKDGELYHKNTKYTNEHKKVWGGEYYRHPETGLLCVMPKQKKQRYSYRRKDDALRFDGIKYEFEQQEIRKRIAPGVFEVETHGVWFKFIPYVVIHKKAVYVRDYDTDKSILPRYMRFCRTVFSHYEDDPVTYYNKVTVSKQEIKKLNLKEYENVK